MKLQRSKPDPQKIAIFGIAAAGKTSIIKTILYEFDAFTTLLPTTGVDRTNIDFFGRELLIWDFGGQELYQEVYLTRPIMYFQGIKYLYYIVDAQDTDKISQSIDYFLKLFEFIMEYSDNVKVYIFFHKIDPEYKGPVKFPQVEEKFLNAVLPKITEFKINPVVFHTSIYNPMTVISAFSQPLLGNQTIYETLCEAIDSYCWERNLQFGFIIIDNYEIGNYYFDKSTFKYVNKLITTYLDWLDETYDPPVFRLGKFDICTKRFTILVGENDFVFNFAVGVDPISELDDMDELFTSMDEFTSALNKILRNSEIIRTGELRTEQLIDAQNLEYHRMESEELEELKDLEDADKQKIIHRNRELEILDEQYTKVKELEDKELEEKKKKEKN